MLIITLTQTHTSKGNLANTAAVVTKIWNELPKHLSVNISGRPRLCSVTKDPTSAGISVQMIGQQ